MNVLKKINKMRLERDWSVYRLSLESGISQSTLTNMFNRETLPSITTLECICHAFGITMAEFFTEEGENEGEKSLVVLYRHLSSEAKQNILALMRELAKN